MRSSGQNRECAAEDPFGAINERMTAAWPPRKERNKLMINMIQNAKDQAAALAMAAYRAAAADGTLPRAAVPAAPVEIPKDTANGDFTTTFAMAAARGRVPSAAAAR